MATGRRWWSVHGHCDVDLGTYAGNGVTRTYVIACKGGEIEIEIETGLGGEGGEGVEDEDHYVLWLSQESMRS